MGDQKPAIEKLAKGIEEGRRHQTLMGVTGSGKTTLLRLIFAWIRSSNSIQSLHDC